MFYVNLLITYLLYNYSLHWKSYTIFVYMLHFTMKVNWKTPKATDKNKQIIFLNKM